MVEFALVLPLLFIVIFGALSGAVAFNNKQDIVYAAREGARYGSVIPQSQCSPTTNCGGKTWAQLVQANVVARAGGEITTAEVCVALVNGNLGNPVGTAFTTKTDGTNCYNDGNNDTGARVQVSISHPASIDAAFLHIPVPVISTTATAHFQ
jgi:Flp pilus assembly protein TadG